MIILTSTMFKKIKLNYKFDKIFKIFKKKTNPLLY